MIETVPVDERGMAVLLGVNGVMMKRLHAEHRLTSRIAVESVEKYLRRVEALGGKVVAPKAEVPRIG
jgi:hypothetical protein